MLEVKDIHKSYQVGNQIQEVLKGVSLKFRESEFVAILGQSGSGKTTLLNIIGGLDYYDSGDLIISGRSTKEFRNIDWDLYRNNSIGFIFQSYNLISHISVIKNVEMGMNLKGVRARERKRRALSVLRRVGLKNHAYKRPNQLSGGQMQRVAIARALVNNPDIILADEPTGALDDETGIAIMDLIKEIAKDKLVIMVTHNPELADAYANRVIKLKSGQVEEDSNPYEAEDEVDTYRRKKVKMSYFQALMLSLNNIRTKIGRMLSISFAASIGIIGIAIILALSNGFQVEIDNYEQESLSHLPIVVSTSPKIVDDDTQSITKEYGNNSFVVVQNDDSESVKHINKIDAAYMEYIQKMDTKYVSTMSYQYGFQLHVVKQNTDSSYAFVDFADAGTWQPFPFQINGEENSLIKQNYDVVAGEVKDQELGLLLVVDEYGRVPKSSLKQLGLTDSEAVTIEFEDILKKELKVVFNNDLYTPVGEYFRMNNDPKELYENQNSATLKVQAIIRGKKEKENVTNEPGFYYTNSLSNTVMDHNKESEIVKAQKEKSFNVLTSEPLEGDTGEKKRQSLITGLGGTTTPVNIQMYPSNYESKDKLISYLDGYNKGKADIDKIEYVDTGETIVSLTRSIMSAITAVLIAFSAISLIVSCIMIAIITYISVLERTKEIGILRALGARKKDIARVFNAETIIIGFVAGVMGVGLAFLLVVPINMFIGDASSIQNIAVFKESQAAGLIMLSVALTLISGYFPALSAANKDPVEALRTE